MAPSRACSAIFGLSSRNTICSSTVRRQFGTSSLLHTTESRLPRVAEPSLWRSLVPKFLRRNAELGDSIKPKSKEWNPATIFIVLGLLVGSNAINIIAIKREMVNFNRKTDAKLELLREVLQKVKLGEAVDVERLLGTGDPQQEKEWEDVMRELESTDVLLESKKRKDAKRVEKAEQRRLREESEKMETQQREGQSPSEPDKSTENTNTRRPKFMM